MISFAAMFILGSVATIDAMTRDTGNGKPDISGTLTIDK